MWKLKKMKKSTSQHRRCTSVVLDTGQNLEVICFSKSISGCDIFFMLDVFACTHAASLIFIHRL
jgi:hypothetical protein